MRRLTKYFSLILTAFGLCLCAACQPKPAGSDEAYNPPWEPTTFEGRNFTVVGLDNLPDIYGDVLDPDLVVFMGGNQFMVVDELMRAFQRHRPQVQRVLVETLPPGILEDQIRRGALIIGRTRFAHRPDVFLAGQNRVERMQKQDRRFTRTVVYCSNRLEIMVHKNNPRNVRGLRDLGRPEVRIAMPNEEWEGIAEKIRHAYRKAGGEQLVRQILSDKLAANTTRLTDIHHRQTPLWILCGWCDAGVVWQTEVLHQQRLGHPIRGIAIPPKHNINSRSAGGVLVNAPHQDNAEAFLDFLVSEEGQAIFRRHGFESVDGDKLELTRKERQQ